MKTFKDSLKEIKNAKVSNDEKMNMLVKLGCTKNECYAIFYNWGKEDERRIAYKFAYTFGVEMEVFNVEDYRLHAIASSKGVNLIGGSGDYNHTNSNVSFKIVRDASISGVNPLECVSPVLGDGGFERLEKMCESLNEAGAKVNKTCGLHVHIGAKGLTSAQYANVFNNYARLEEVIDSFMAKSRRANNAYFAQSIKGRVENCRTREDIWREFCGTRTPDGSMWRSSSRYYKVNSMSWFGHSTIEFRQHQGSTDFEKISNWVRFCAKLVEFSKTNRLTSDVNSIHEIPFLTEEEIAFFEGRARKLA